MAGQPGLFDLQDRDAELSKSGDGQAFGEDTARAAMYLVRRVDFLSVPAIACS